MRLKNALFLVVLLVVVAAGCTGTGTKGKVSFDQNAGVKIDQFSFDVSELFEKEQTTLTLKVQNVGAKSMSADSKLWVYGPQMYKSSPIPPTTPTEKWATDEDVPITKTLSTSTFLPPDVERGIPGSVDMQSISMAAPLVPENMKNDYTFYARVCYPYNTTAITKLVATTKNQLRTEAVKKTDAITRASAGPIQLSMQSGENIVAGRQMQLVFDVTDVGGGFATVQGATLSTTCTGLASADVSTSSINKVTVIVNVDGDPTDCTGSKPVSISTGKGVIYCKYTPPTTSTTPASPKTEYMVSATASYNYFLTKQAAITVKDEAL